MTPDELNKTLIDEGLFLAFRTLLAAFRNSYSLNEYTRDVNEITELCQTLAKNIGLGNLENYGPQQDLDLPNAAILYLLAIRRALMDGKNTKQNLTYAIADLRKAIKMAGPR